MTWILVLLAGSALAVAPIPYGAKEECEMVGEQFKATGYYTRDFKCLPGPKMTMKWPQL